jgi:bifunctional UDP-N-acetylglucosamine pyrophosphorylase/glucosamine-1-phosphate N-acetyltransferase
VTRKLDAVILAGGEGKRLKSPTPKVVLELLGRPVIGHVLDALRTLNPQRIVVVGGKNLPFLKAALKDEPGVKLVRQPKPRGTAHALKYGLAALPEQRGRDVMILNGDGPLVRSESLAETLRQHRDHRSDVTVISARFQNPVGMGRIVRDGDGRFLRIVEEKDATDAERLITEINAGQYVVRTEALRKLLPQIGTSNAQGEYYLTDLVGLASRRVLAVPLADSDEALGINSYADFLTVHRILSQRIAAEHTSRGVTILDPFLTHIEAGVTIEPGTVIHPFCVLRRGVSIRARSTVGPFAHIRAGSVLGEDVRVGNFVEVKASALGAAAKALHLTYLGDAQVGAGANLGAGTITANFDGTRKHPTEIGEGASIGSGTILVAPVKIGKHAVTGAGAVVTAGSDVADSTTVVGVPARPVVRKKQTKGPSPSGGSSTANRRRRKP